jgi:serine/threonine protein kinase
MMDVSAPTETDSQRSQRIRGNSKLVERRASKFDDNYSMGEEIGRGSFSEVREGMGIDGNQRVAVKTIMKKGVVFDYLFTVVFKKS